VRNVLQDLYSQTNTPTIGDLIKQLKQKKTDPLVFKLEKFTKGFYGRLLNQRKSTIPFNEIRKKNVIFELGGIPAEVRTFFVSTFLIMWWDCLKLSESTPHVLVLDDFQRYSELSVVRKMLSEARKFKQGLICSHQGPYQLSDMMRSEIVRNTATKIIFRQEQTWDKYIVRDALGGLEKHQLENLSYLETGQCIVKLPSVKVPIRVDTFAPPAGRGIEDWEVANAMEKYAGVIKREEPRHEEPIEKIFLENIYKDPYMPLTKLAKIMRIKTERCYDIKRRLIRTGYLIEENVRIGRGRPRKALKLTRKALQALGIRGKTPAHYGGSEHVLMVNKIASILRKSWDVKIEDSCDVRAERNGRKIAIEIETWKAKGDSQLLYNVKRDSKWADKIIVVCPNKQSKLDIEEKLAGFEKVDVITYAEVDRVEEFLDGT